MLDFCNVMQVKKGFSPVTPRFLMVIVEAKAKQSNVTRLDNLLLRFLGPSTITSVLSVL